jgi:hypothetical protein
MILLISYLSHQLCSVDLLVKKEDMEEQEVLSFDIGRR